MTSQRIIDKIRAMLAKTVDNGCTEAEAMAALEMAQTMMDQYEVTEDDLKLEDEKAIIRFSDMRDPQNIRWKLAYFIGKFTDTYTYGHKKSIKFVGLKGNDVMTAGSKAGENASFGRPVEQGGMLRIGKE